MRLGDLNMIGDFFDSVKKKNVLGGRDVNIMKVMFELGT